MSAEIYIIRGEEIPEPLLEIPKPPKQLYVQGKIPKSGSVYLTVVGSRDHSRYALDALSQILEGIKEFPIVIVSGLALGIDTIAHRLAIRHGLTTIAFPGSGLSDQTLYPRSNLKLRDEILESGGAIFSEHEPDFRATMWSFPERNRLMAGIARATLIVEAKEKSGTLITARLALDYNRDVLVIPGDITRETSRGTNGLLRLGATPILSSADLIEALGFSRDGIETRKKVDNMDLTKDEEAIMKILRDPTERDEIVRMLGKPAHEVFATLALLEIKGLIKEELGEVRRI